MKSKFTYILSLVLLLLSTACEKYLDIVPKGEEIIENADQFYNMVSFPNRAYPINNFQYLVDDQYLKESNVIGLPATNINVLNFTFNESINRPNIMTSSSLYNQAYKYILRWNTIISLVDDSKGEVSVKQLAKAEARVLRAFDHFVILNTFAKHYDPAKASTQGGICIMDEYNLEAKPVKSTVAEVYAFIEKDLDESIPFLQTNPENPYHPSLAYAYALKAKVHLFKKEFEKAKAAAKASLALKSDIYDLVAYTAAGGPAKVNVPVTSNPEILNLVYMTGYNELNFGYSYIISPELRTLFGANDARFNLFFNTTNATWLDMAAGTAWWNIKYTAFFYPTVGMKTTEVQLMLAECEARGGNLTEAIRLMNEIRVKRITNTAEATLAVPATIKETMDLLIQERRKELLFGFNRFWDLRRFNTEPDYAKTIVRVFPLVNKTVPQVTYTLKPDSKLYTIPFAQDVLKLNPGLTLNTDEAMPW
ncbi:RagB/SusD family nutrient uptake outer membrane protein [Pedobacter sp. AW31-3R]|uniref:RagB/SusD family nutrient uptake outer membrane protein n=1 Tax=Pedobacter sp. AW31-3R TaxID=3445781 RepID=UPI003FA05C58